MLMLITAPNLRLGQRMIPQYGLLKNLPITFDMPQQLFHQPPHRLNPNRTKLWMRHNLLPRLDRRNLSYQFEVCRQREQLVQAIASVHFFSPLGQYIVFQKGMIDTRTWYLQSVVDIAFPKIKYSRSCAIYTWLFKTGEHQGQCKALYQGTQLTS